jgi:HTH-like domain
MIAFIDDHRAAHGLEPRSGSRPICRVLPIAPSTYHAHAAKRTDPGKLSARARRDVALQAEIRRVWEANFQIYGMRKVWRQLQREAIRAPRCQVMRLMKRKGLAGVVRGKTAKTTHSDKSAPCPLDQVNQDGPVSMTAAPTLRWPSTGYAGGTFASSAQSSTARTLGAAGNALSLPALRRQIAQCPLVMTVDALRGLVAGRAMRHFRAWTGDDGNSVRAW